MASVLFSNNASAALASSITASTTTITVTTGAGAQFPAIASGNYFYATLTDASNNLEIVKVTARASDVLTVLRAQEGTTARAYAAADKVELRVTSAALTEYVTLSITNALEAAKQALYPVGSIYSNATSASNPAALLGFGTWTAFGVGRVLIGNGGGFTAGATGGSADAITVAHTHIATSTFSGSALGSHTHSITDPGHSHTVKRNAAGTPGSDQTGFAAAGFDGNNSGPITTDSVTTGVSVNSASAGTPSGSVSTTVDSTGSSGTGANLQPYVVVYMWTRTA